MPPRYQRDPLHRSASRAVRLRSGIIARDVDTWIHDKVAVACGNYLEIPGTRSVELTINKTAVITVTIAPVITTRVNNSQPRIMNNPPSPPTTAAAKIAGWAGLLIQLQGKGAAANSIRDFEQVGIAAGGIESQISYAYRSRIRLTADHRGCAKNCLPGGRPSGLGE